MRQFKTDPHADQDTLDELDDKYYDTGFDPSLHELQQLQQDPDSLEQQKIDTRRKLLLRQLTIVAKRVFNMILDSQVT